MTQLIQTAPNFSEGIDKDIMSGLKERAETGDHHVLMDAQTDSDHNRSTYYLLGEPESVLKATYEMVKFATEKIDMNEHVGVHPRMGASDVVPVIPVKNISIEECVELAKELGQKIGEELEVPVYLYEDAASNEERKNLANVRRGEYEGLPEKMKDENWKPDYGPSTPHPTAGAVAVGARPDLVYLNVNLDTNHLDIAQDIAKTVRKSNGGLDHLKAIGVNLEDRDMVQVTTTITNYKELPFYRVLENIRMEAKRYGVDVVSTEVYGMTPAQAMIDTAVYYLQAERFDSDKQVVENFLL